MFKIFILLIVFLSTLHCKVFSENEIANEILRVSKKYNLDASMLYTIAMIESKFEPLAIAVETSNRSAKILSTLRSKGIRVVSGKAKTYHSKKAIVSIYPDDLETAKTIIVLLEKFGFTFDVGLMQINTCNFTLKEVEAMFYPKNNLEKSAKHLSGCVRRYQNTVHQIECYNRGAGNLNKMLKKKIYYYPYYKEYKKVFDKTFKKRTK